MASRIRLMLLLQCCVQFSLISNKWRFPMVIKLLVVRPFISLLIRFYSNQQLWCCSVVNSCFLIVIHCFVWCCTRVVFFYRGRFLMVTIKCLWSVLYFAHSSKEGQSRRFPMVTYVWFFILSYFGYELRKITFVFTTLCPFFTYFFKMALPNGRQNIDRTTSYFMWHSISLRLIVGALPGDRLVFFSIVIYCFVRCCRLLDGNQIIFLISTCFTYYSKEQWLSITALPNGYVRINFYQIIFWLRVAKK